MITLEDIAREAGVSHSTVSRALADSPLVNDLTKARIRELASKAGYQVNQVARNLKIRSTRTIGLVVPEVSNPYYPKLIQCVADLVRAAGYSLQLHLSGADQGYEVACLQSLQENRADGILLVTAEHGLVAREQAEKLTAMGTPLVLMGWIEAAETMCLVTGDDAHGGYLLAQHLAELGHQNIATLGKAAHRGKYDRLYGFTNALSDAGIRRPQEIHLENESDEEVAHGIQRLLTSDSPPTALFAYQDSLAARVYKYLNEVGVSIPGDMTVVGFDDLDLASYLSPRLTTVGGHIEPLTREFVRILLDRIKNPDSRSSPERVVISPRLVVRASSAPARTAPLHQRLTQTTELCP